MMTLENATFAINAKTKNKQQKNHHYYGLEPGTLCLHYQANQKFPLGQKQNWVFHIWAAHHCPKWRNFQNQRALWNLERWLKIKLPKRLVEVAWNSWLADSSSQLVTWTKSVTKLGIAHFMMTSLPLMTYSGLTWVS